MMTAALLKQRMEAQPFRPFRIHMPDGKTYDITNHDAMFVKRNVVEIGADLDADSIAERFMQCSILHITSVEGLTSAKVV
jgi:hypothetical protein